MVYPHAFAAPLVRHANGKAKVLVDTVGFLPVALAAESPFRGDTPLRVEGEVADVPFTGAFQPNHGSANPCWLPPGRLSATR